MADKIKDYQGKEYDPAVILALSKQVTSAIDPNAIKGGVFSTKGESVGFNYDEATKLLGRPPTATEQVVLDMSRHLVNEGITDLKTADLSEVNRRFGSTFTGGGGTIYEIKKDAEGNPVISTWSKDTSDKKTILGGLALAALAFGIPGVSEGLLSGAPAGSTLGAIGADAVATTVGTTGLTVAELAQLDLALGGAGGTAGATTLGNALLTGATVPTITSLTGGSGMLTGAAGGITAESVAAKLAADAKASSAGLFSNLNATDIAKVVAGGLKTTGGLLQQQTSKEAAQAAQAMIDRETAAAKQAAQFRPVGMTSRFGTSSFSFDPVTGQMTGADYQLSPELLKQQDRFMALSETGLTQAEQGQAQFAPLQTGAQRLFGLGNQYLAQSPEEVAQRYISNQMNLLAPGRELELANLQNKLVQQGRTGLSVAQGGSLGATTPELQALFNARAMQEAQLAANAEEAGKRDITFGSGLLSQGAQTMGQYYGGQQAAYIPYTTAMGQVQNLEALGQQPLNMSTQLAQQSAQAGANVGRMGLTGAQISAGLATGAAATTNPYATVLGGLSDPTSTISQGVAEYIRRNWV